MLALLPESTEKMRDILTWASAYADMIGQRLVPEIRWSEMQESRNAWKSRYDSLMGQSTDKIRELERSRDDWMDLHRQARLRISELEAELQTVREGSDQHALIKFNGGFYHTENGIRYLPDLTADQTVEQQLSEECTRLLILWHNAEHRLIQIKALTSSEKTA